MIRPRSSGGGYAARMFGGVPRRAAVAAMVAFAVLVCMGLPSHGCAPGLEASPHGNRTVMTAVESCDCGTGSECVARPMESLLTLILALLHLLVLGGALRRDESITSDDPPPSRGTTRRPRHDGRRPVSLTQLCVWIQ